MSIRPFRHLCPESDRRDAMSDEEFWQDVAASLSGHQWDGEDAGDDIDSLNADPCPECGSTGACGWDSEGRPMIHAIGGDDE